MHGQFVWYELMTTDATAAQRFYPTITGWGTKKWDDPTLEYTMWTVGGMPVGGTVQLTAEQRAQGVKPNWLPYVAVDSVDGAAARATSLGGKVIVAPQDVPGVGRFAIIQDPQGASIAVYRASGPSGTFDGTPNPGHMSWHELMTTDYQAALSFYNALFGWQKLTEIDIGGGAMYLIFGHDGKRYGGMFNRLPEWGDAPPYWLPYINVRDVKVAQAAITSGGARIMNGPMEVPGGDWIIQASDPQGVVFAVHQVAAAKPAGKAKPAPRKKSKARSSKKAKKAAKSKAKSKTRKRAPKAAAKGRKAKGRKKKRRR